MLCPFCRKSLTKVIDKRDINDSIRRRRECLECGKRFTTYERIEMLNLYVIKKNGSREVFDADKLRKGLMRACEKRGISMERIEAAVSSIESNLRTQKTNEVQSKLVGELAMRQLKKLDKVAYVRFASVYREFADVTSFQDEIKQLLKR